jgi:putative endonuclease
MKISNPIGVKGEQVAATFLEKKGYKIIDRNFRKKYGEIDIIAVYKNTLVFIEVKTRTSTDFGTGFEAISPWKLRLLMKTGQLYRVLHPRLPESLRIDAISVLLSKSGEVETIEHLESISD